MYQNTPHELDEMTKLVSEVCRNMFIEILNQILNHLSLYRNCIDVDLINRHRNNLLKIVNDKQTN